MGETEGGIPTWGVHPEHAETMIPRFAQIVQEISVTCGELRNYDPPHPMEMAMVELGMRASAVLGASLKSVSHERLMQIFAERGIGKDEITSLIHLRDGTKPSH